MKTPMPTGVLAKIQKVKCHGCGTVMPYPGPEACVRCAGTVLELIEVEETDRPKPPPPHNPFYRKDGLK